MRKRSITVQLGKRRKGQTWLSILPCYTVALGVCLCLAWMPRSALAVIVVDPTLTPCGAAAIPTHTTVQAGVNAAIAAVDPVVQICPGDYSENVTVMGTSGLTITGVGATKADVKIIGSGTAGPIISVVSGASVSISNLTVDGMSMMVPPDDPSCLSNPSVDCPENPDFTVVGVQYGLVPGVIRNVMVQNIRNMDGSAEGIGINAVGQDLATFNPSSPPTETLLRILQCMVMNTTRVGIRADGQGINVNVEQCLMEGPNAPKVWAPNGVQVSRGAKGTIENSDFDDFTSPTPAGGAGSGMTFLCPAVNSGGVAVARHNIVKNSDLGIAVVDADGVRVASNTVIDTEIGITMQSQGMFFEDPACFTPLVSPQNSQIVSNLILDATEAGVQSADFSSGGPAPEFNDIEDNAIFTDIMVGMAPIAVSAGQDNTFVDNLVFGGPTSQLVDESTGSGTAGTANRYANFCFGVMKNPLCTGSTGSPGDPGGLLPPPRPAHPFVD